MNTLGRVCVVLVICLGLPLLAMPKVRQKVEDFIYGKLESVIPPLPAKSPHQEEAAPPEIKRAGFDAPLSAPPLTPSGNPFPDLSPARPPDLAPVPTDRPPSNPLGNPAAPPVQVTEAMMNQVRAIRRQLEDLGAEYILLESADNGRSFRFHCEMAMDAERRRLQPFEASSPNPLQAADTVLRQVIQWRQPAVSQ